MRTPAPRSVSVGALCMADRCARRATDSGAHGPAHDGTGNRARGGLLFNGGSAGGGPGGQGGDGEYDGDTAHDGSPVRLIKRQRGCEGSTL